MDAEGRGRRIEIETTGGRIHAYRADPDGGVPLGGLVLIHEIWGLVPHICDVADRLAAEGYLVVAPDILSNAGVTPDVGADLAARRSDPDPAVRHEAQPMLREALSATRSPEYAEWAVGVLTQVVDYLDAQGGVDGRIGAVGFCFGGSYVWALAAEDTRLKAAIPFYGAAPSTATLADITAPVLGIYGADDERIVAGLAELTEALSEADVEFIPVVYSGVGHAFFNDTNAIAYSADAADDAWATTLAFLGARLR